MPVRCKVPTTLSGGSLLDAHKWVKSQMAKSNPGGSADYTLRNPEGGSVTLSDIIRNNPNNVEVEIVTNGIGGVRSNPRGISIPTDFSSSPSFPRTGNFTMALLPNRLDPQLVERMVAQEGLFAAVQTLTILLSERSVAESISPRTAGLLYAHSAIPRKNPSVKTPFLGDAVKEMVDSDIRISQYLYQQFEVDIEAHDGIIGKAKISATYGLTRRMLDTFVDDVLAPFLAVAPANRGALREINKKIPQIKTRSSETKTEIAKRTGKKIVGALTPEKLKAAAKKAGFKTESDYAKAYAKLMELLPTRAEDFYHGREFGLLANPQCIYPILADRIIRPGVVLELLKVADKYPDNLKELSAGPTPPIGRAHPQGWGLELTKKQGKIIRGPAELNTRGGWRARFKRIFYPGSSNIMDSFDSKLKMIKGTKKGNENYMDHIIKAIQAPGLADSADPEKQYFVFTSNIGGFFPSPPNKWPQQVVYAVMDTLLQSIPDIVDIDNPEENYESRVYMALASPKLADEYEFIFDENKDVTITMGKVKEALGDSQDEVDKRSVLVDLLNPVPGASLPTDMKEPENGLLFLQYVLDNCARASNTFSVDPKYGKSIFELLFEVMETSQGKYNYELVDQDITFALILLDFSIRQLFEDGKIGKTPKTGISIGGIIGEGREKGLRKQIEAVLDQEDSLDRFQEAAIIGLGLIGVLGYDLVQEVKSGTTKVDDAIKELENHKRNYASNNYDSRMASLGEQAFDQGLTRLQKLKDGGM